MNKLIVSAITLAALLVFAGCATTAPAGGETEETAMKIARCVKEKGAKFYGAFWCPKCGDQKKAFGKKAEAELPYFECDPRGENSVTDECLKLKIEKYPTWIFPDGTREVGVLGLSELAAKAGCPEEELAKY